MLRETPPSPAPRAPAAPAAALGAPVARGPRPDAAVRMAAAARAEDWDAFDGWREIRERVL